MLSAHLSNNSQKAFLEKENIRVSNSRLTSQAERGAYDPFHTPPDFQMAINHGLAKRVYKPQAHKISESIVKRVCPCCGLPIHGELIPIKAELKELYHLGSGYALYFKLTKYCAAILGVMLLISGLFNLISNKTQDGCASEYTEETSFYCVQNYIISYTIANKRNNTALLDLQMALNLLTVVALFIFIQYIRYVLNKTTYEIEHNVITPADYTIQVIGIPLNLSNNEIQEWIESLGDSKHQIKCKKINRAYDIRDYIKLYQDKDALIEKSNQEHDHISRYMIEDDIQELDSKINNLKEKDLRLTNRVFISFEKPEDVKYVIKKTQGVLLGQLFKNIKRRFEAHTNKFDGKGTVITKAPEPTDVIWENQGIDEKENLKRRLKSDIWGAVLIIISFLLIVLISYGQNIAIKHLGQDSRSFIRLLSGVASVFVVTINAIIAYATIYLSRREKHSTYTSYFTGVARRLCIAMFINTAFTTIFAKLASVAFGSNSDDDFNFYRPGGVLENIFYVFISNAVLSPLYYILDPFHFYKVYKRSRALELGEGNTMTQQKAHELFEQTEMDLSYQNSFLVKTVLVSAFFAPAVPFALIISIFGLIFTYWVDKSLLLRRNSLPISLGHELSSYMLSVLQWTGFVFALGNLLFVLTLEDSSQNTVFFNITGLTVIITILFSLLHTIIPEDSISSKLFPSQKRSVDKKPYDESRVLFPTDYDIENPVTSREGFTNFIDFIKSRQTSTTLMKTSLKKGAFNMLLSANMKDLVSKKGLSESAEIKKENDLVFLQGYASKVHKGGLKLSNQKFEKEKNISVDELFGITEEDLLNFDNPNTDPENKDPNAL